MRYLVILVALMAAGCGQKGALFLPDSAPKQQPEQTADDPLKSGA